MTSPSTRPAFTRAPRLCHLLNAHTWPDNSAMGNRLLNKLGTGGSLALISKAGDALCYQVVERIRVDAERVSEAQLSKIYATNGPPQAVIIVCSGSCRTWGFGLTAPSGLPGRPSQHECSLGYAWPIHRSKPRNARLW
ncbi:MAG: hypothetical protein R2709_10860 [Marmoricola sp.]